MPPLTGFQYIFSSFPGLRCCAAPPRATIYRPSPGLSNSVRCAHINAPRKLVVVGGNTIGVLDFSPTFIIKPYHQKGGTEVPPYDIDKLLFVGSIARKRKLCPYKKAAAPRWSSDLSENQMKKAITCDDGVLPNRPRPARKALPWWARGWKQRWLAY